MRNNTVVGKLKRYSEIYRLFEVFDIGVIEQRNNFAISAMD